MLQATGDRNALIGGDGNDQLKASGNSNTLDGQDGNDSLFIAGGSNNNLMGGIGKRSRSSRQAAAGDIRRRKFDERTERSITSDRYPCAGCRCNKIQPITFARPIDHAVVRDRSGLSHRRVRRRCLQPRHAIHRKHKNGGARCCRDEILQVASDCSHGPPP